MNNFNLNFDATQVAPQQGTIPLDTYDVQICNGEVKPTSSGDGAFLELSLIIMSGPQQGMKQSDRLNIWNSNEKAVQIARQRLSAYCHCIGVYQLNSPNAQELFGRPFKAKLGPQK